MQLVVKPFHIESLNEYLNIDSAIALLFGMHDFSTYDKTISYEDLEKIKKQYPNTNIYVSLDKNFFNNEIESLKEMLKKLDTLNLSGILFYDLSVLAIHNEENLKTPLVWNQNFLVTNYQTCNFYKEKGVEKAILSSEITLEEIKEIAMNTSMELFVNIFGYQLMSFSKRKLVTNYLEYINKETRQEKNYLLKEGKKYRISENKVGTAIFTSHVLNGLTKIEELKQIDVNIILDEIDINHEIFIKVIEAYKKAIEINLTNEEINILDKEIKDAIPNTSLGFLDKKTIYKVKKEV